MAVSGQAREPMDEVMRDSLGEHADALADLAALVREQVLTGIESLTTARPSLSDISFGPLHADGLQAEFDETPHVGLELTLIVPGESATAGAMLIPLMDLGGLLGIESGEDRMEDPDFAVAQLQVVSGAAREFFDLLSMTLFVDALAGVEVVPADARVGDIVSTLAAVGDGGAAVRLDVGLAMPDGQLVRLVLLLPQSFLGALGVVSTRRSRLRPLRLTRAGAPFGLASDLDEFERAEAGEPDNVSPFRSAGTFGTSTAETSAHPVRFPPLTEPRQSSAERRSLDLIMDVSMRVTVELGRSTLTVEEVLSLGPGSVVELNKLAGEPVDVLVNEQLIARGEVVVVDENFGVRVTEIVSPRRRAQAMGA
jgi:flagellar motor switch protein FliN